MFNIGDAAREEIKAVSIKIAVTVEQRVDATVEEIRAVPDRAVESVEWAIENSLEDMKDTLIQVDMVMEEEAGVA